MLNEKAGEKKEGIRDHRLSENAYLLKKLTDQLPGALYQLLRYPGGESSFLYVSNGLTDIFEVTPEELMNDAGALQKRIHPGDAKRVHESIESANKNMQIWDCEFRVELPVKGLRWVRGLSRPEKIDDGGVLSHGYFEDITEKKKANDWVRYLNSALMNISESVIITNSNSRVIYANQKVKDLHGFEPVELIGKHAEDMSVNPMNDEQLSVFHKTLAEGRTYVGVGLSRRKDGSTFVCEYSVTPIYGDEYATYIGVQRDITERERILVALEESNERFEQLTQHSRAIAWETNKDGVFTYVSGAVQTVFGYQQEEIESKGDVFDLIVPSMRNKMRSGFLYALKKGKSFSNIVCPFADRFGNTVLLSINGIPKFNTDKTLRSYRGLAIDVTEKAKMQQQILVEEERYKTTLLSVGEGVISTDCTGKITVMNPLAEKMTGWLQQDAAGKCLGLILKVIDEQHGRICESPANIVLQTSRVFQPYFPTLLVSKSGEEIPIQIIAAPIKKNTGDISGVVIVFRNFSEYRERQKQIEFLSYHDHLTGLFNRRYLNEAYKKLNIPSNLPLTVMTLDVNGLKLTNDAFGHEMGDRLLTAVADILRKACRANEIIARVGGDEFSILLPRTDTDKAELIKQRIIKATSETKLDPVIISMAIGYSVKRSMSDGLESVLIDADNQMYKEKFNQGKTMRSQTIEKVLLNINSKFEQEKIHTERVSQYCYAIADALRLSEKEKAEIRLAGLLHDIGKITVPTDLLRKPGKLTDEELDVIRRHPETGYQILKSVDEYVTIARYVLHHHERWDGTGYPAGLKGEEIPLQSRIIAVADAYEAMTAERPYQKKRTNKEAKAELKKCSCTQFDPLIVRIFLESVLNEDSDDTNELP